MELKISLIQLIIICAVANGFVFGFLLLEKRENRFANRFLSLAIICTCLTFTPYMLGSEVWTEFRWLAWLPFSLAYWIGPSFYFYVQALTDSSKGFSRRHLWHFSPVILNYLHSIYHLMMGKWDPFPGFHKLAEVLESLALVSILIYMLLSLGLVKKYQKSLLDTVSNVAKIDLQWIKHIITVLILSFLVVLVFLVFSDGIGGTELLYQWGAHKSAILLPYACMLYWLSIHGYRQAQTITLTKMQGSELEPNIGDSSKVIAQLKHVMEYDKLFRNPELSLSELSKAIGISERTISETLNGGLQKNFYQFVNEYRIKDVQEKLKNPENSQLKILSLAFDSGFNSKATFNRLFKGYTGVTPKDYKSQNLKDEHLLGRTIRN